MGQSVIGSKTGKEGAKINILKTFASTGPFIFVRAEGLGGVQEVPEGVFGK